MVVPGEVAFSYERVTPLDAKQQRSPLQARAFSPGFKELGLTSSLNPPQNRRLVALISNS